ncbi:glycosyltransferase [Clostridium sp. 19966]|uniref:glycosyltransferase n=1 Tax=Clostridium sp. 19966 TaxID=2768166 RepID=UPI0028E04971|nr:glycosyltransferase [Clostridium sp. 19966]MDT8716146.1 glycosyltransferase [Clostridium sp. 19966]
MVIIHYTLGLPPYRTGGLTKYSIDLATEEAKHNEVYILFPGRYTATRRTKINFYKSFKGIKCYEIYNPLPVSLTFGIKRPQNFMEKQSKEVFRQALLKLKPDVIHIHTLMGLHIEFLQIAKQMQIKLLYTTHDYFGICPKVNLLDFDSKICINYGDGKRCAECNKSAISTTKIKIMQGGIYRKFKDTSIIKYIRNKQKKNIREEKKISLPIDINEERGKGYISLRNYYLSMLRIIGNIHYNSALSKKIYNQYIDIKGEIINISHADIKNNKKIRSYKDTEPLKLLFLAETEKYKGFDLLIDSLYRLVDNNNWILSVWGNTIEMDCGKISDRVIFNGRYKYEDLSKIFQENDILVVPSIWPETFGYTVLEAISYAFPVIVTDNVGAKDIIQDQKTGFIVSANQKDISILIEKIINSRILLTHINKNIYENNDKNEFYNHYKAIIEYYNKI